MTKLLRSALIFIVVLGQACKPRTQTGSIKADIQGNGSFPIWSYDAGPDPQSSMGRELIDLNSRIPYFPGLSMAIYGDQMFRPAFGPIPWRMMQQPNSVKILFIGQDGTHIAEAAGRPATAGFGGRAQDLAKYFGVSSSAAFINTFAFTIRWQYGAFDTPIISMASGRPQLNFGSFTGNQVWLISQDLESPIVKWRNDLISWIIRNNRDSLKMIVLFGGSARDSLGAYVSSKGGVVGSRYSEQDLAKIRIPEFKYEGSGGNKQTVVPLMKDGYDLFARFNGSTPNYRDPEALKDLQSSFRAAFNQSPDEWMSKMVLPEAGLGRSGVLHPAQLGGYDVNHKMSINGENTISLKGLRIASDLTIDHDILVTQLPHPTALSMMNKQAASEAVARGLKDFPRYVEQGWTIEADPGFVNSYAAGQEYRYARADMGTEYYDFGAPKSRMVNVSSASRSGSNVIIFGTRDRPNFEQNTIKAMTSALPSKFPPKSELWSARPTSTDSTLVPSEKNRRYTFDPGPGEEFARIMKTTLPQDEAFLSKHEVNGDFGHYRGTFVDPKVVILADPDGEDDLITARALTGTRGQYLHGLMTDIGVGDQYLVIKTAPYSSNRPDWEEILNVTKPYREALLTKIFESSTPQFIITDGPSADAELRRIFPRSPAPVVSIHRAGTANDSGIAEAVEQIKAISGFENASFSGKMLDIPRRHLSYYARGWEGTSGDRVITSSDQYKGKAFAEVAPKWAYTQKYGMPPEHIEDCERLVQKLNDEKLRLGGESVQSYLSRRNSGSPGKSRCGEQAQPAAALEIPFEGSEDSTEGFDAQGF
ncbi:MAG: hypothetical protein AB7T49_14085 [Oligoflexales bacterium]